MHDWRKDIHQVLREEGIRQIPYTPDNGLKDLIKLCEADEQMIPIPLANEMEGITMTAGAWLGGQRSAMMMQCGGVGNSINALSVLTTARFPFLSIITMRGTFGENNPWQIPMGQATRPCLEAIGCIVLELNRGEDATKVTRAAVDMAYGSGSRVALLLTQELIGAKRF